MSNSTQLKRDYIISTQFEIDSLLTSYNINDLEELAHIIAIPISELENIYEHGIYCKVDTIKQKLKELQSNESRRIGIFSRIKWFSKRSKGECFVYRSEHSTVRIQIIAFIVAFVITLLCLWIIKKL